jgi:ketosteroid isomerase-like protein
LERSVTARDDRPWNLRALMSASENKQLLQGIFAELAKSNARPFVNAMADDFRWTLLGSNKWARAYEGKRAVVDDLFGTLAKHMDRITTIPDRFIADGDYVAVEAHGANTTKGGLPYNNRYCFVFRIADGKLAEVTEYMDTELVTKVLGDP